MPEPTEIINAIQSKTFRSKIHVGTQIQIEFMGKKFSIIRGTKHPHFIMIDTPLSKGKHLVFDNQKKIMLRFIFEGVVYGFETVILKQFFHPHILILKFPSTVSAFNLRKNKRVKLLIPIFIAAEAKGQRYQGALMNISEEGCLLSIRMKLKLNCGDPCYVSFELPTGKKINSLMGEIVRVEDYEESIIYGVKFSEKDLEHIGQIKTFLKYCRIICLEEESLILDSEETESGMYKLGQEVSVEINKKTIKSTLRGWKKVRDEGYLLVDPPKKTDEIEVPKLGSGAYVRCKAEGILYGIETKLVANMAGNIWMLSFKGDAMEHSIRMNKRFSCIIPVSIFVNKEKGFESIGKGLITDISMNGVAIISNKEITLAENKMAVMNFFLAGFGVIEYLKFKLIRGEKHEGHYEYAGTFLELREKDEKKLNLFFDFCGDWSFE
ncbi:MAG: flagellar brake protein [Nitrospinae bacterium]|nr:flagellar brake protein [Nitrospinota bacterium]